MPYTIRFEAEAKSDLLHSFLHYESLVPDLGTRFEKYIFDCIDKVAKNPFVYQQVYKKIRRCALRKFPFILYFYVDTDEFTITIIAIFHSSRNPNIWKGRLV